jgi:nucleoside phosphorylase
VLLGVLPHMRRQYNDPKKPDKIAEHIKLMDDMPDYRRLAEDRLYRADYLHKGGKNCEDCAAEELEDRPPRSTLREVTVYYGIIASSNSVIKNSEIRENNARELNVLCFEMEAAGLANNFRCLVIRGICDYSDSHKNDEWYKYAVLTAAAYAREVLYMLRPERVSDMPPWAEEVKEGK